MFSIRVFASHDWGQNQENHKAVARVVDMLRKRGINVWFDETHMKGNILQAMTRGIDAADLILVFITQNYMDKVRGDSESDNVRREFMYASQYAEKMLPIRFDTNLPAKWQGPVGMLLQSRLYTDLTTISDKTVDVLVQAIRNATPRTLWKLAAQKAIVLPPGCGGRKFITNSPKVPVRERVRRLVELHGLTMRQEPTVETVERLLLSFGIQVPGTMGMVDKIVFLENELKAA